MVPPNSEQVVCPLYRPILHSGCGELEALRHLDEAAVPLLSPLLEVRSPDDYRWLPRRLTQLPAELTVAVDISTWDSEVSNTELLRWGVPLVPVIGLSERDHRLVAHGKAARSGPQRAVVRLRVRRDPGNPDAATAAMERIWRLAQLVPEQCDLLIDLTDVCCSAETRAAEPRARRLVGWARRHAWNSVTVAAGAMPPTLASLPPGQPDRLPRWDWILWCRLADLGVGYADYGIGSAMVMPGERLPTLRYTSEESWWVYRWSRRDGRDRNQFNDLCHALVAASHWPPEGARFSWGDQEIIRRARRTGSRCSPVNWTAWGTSHHLAMVLNQLCGPAPYQHNPLNGRAAGPRGGQPTRVIHASRSPWGGGKTRRA